jgi:hypothetical protein
MFCAYLDGAYANKASQHLADTVQRDCELDYVQARHRDAFERWLFDPRRYAMIR